MLFAACVGTPKREQSNYNQRNYSFSVLLYPEQPGKSPQLKIALSLIGTRLPADTAQFLYSTLYSGKTPEQYKDSIITEQRDAYHGAQLVQENPNEPYPASFNWSYRETFQVQAAHGPGGVVVEQVTDTFTGGAHPNQTKRYYVIDLEAKHLLTIDEMFSDYRNERVYSLVMAGLRRYSKLTETQPLSQGIYFSDDPELTTDFFVSEEGLGLHWNPTDIAPYVDGHITITLPWRDIRPLLLHSGMETMTKFGILLFVAGEPGNNPAGAVAVEPPPKKPSASSVGAVSPARVRLVKWLSMRNRYSKHRLGGTHFVLRGNTFKNKIFKKIEGVAQFQFCNSN